jgi:hypothetical protein
MPLALDHHCRATRHRSDTAHVKEDGIDGEKSTSPRSSASSLSTGNRRSSPASRRFTHTLSDDDNAINGQAELSRDDDATGEHDLAITYRKIG